MYLLHKFYTDLFSLLLPFSVFSSSSGGIGLSVFLQHGRGGGWLTTKALRLLFRFLEDWGESAQQRCANK
ncbi:unnamed protein product, partial [Mesorhabditis spiculigera]